MNFILGTFPISRDPPEGGTSTMQGTLCPATVVWFPISRDPPEGGTVHLTNGVRRIGIAFPISRDPPEGGTSSIGCLTKTKQNKQSSFQFLGIPPKGEHSIKGGLYDHLGQFPISRDPPEGGTTIQRL